MSFEIGEVEQIITPDGVIYSLSTGLERAITQIGGRGMPSAEFLTQQGYLQPYPVVTGWRLEPRQVTLTLTFASESRSDYWIHRAALVDALRFNRGGPFTLRHIRADGTRRDLYAYAVEGSPLFETDLVWETDTEEITLIAFDPLFKNPDFKTEVQTYTVTVDQELVFPITFPIRFEPSLYYNLIMTINYGGTFVTYPIIQINGPYTEIVLTNRQTGAKVGLTVPIAAGETRIIDLDPRRRSVVDGNGLDRFNELLLPDSNLVAFNLRPAGQAWENNPFEGVAGGINELELRATDPDSTTSVYVTYREQFVAL